MHDPDIPLLKLYLALLKTVCKHWRSLEVGDVATKFGSRVEAVCDK